MTSPMTIVPLLLLLILGALAIGALIAPMVAQIQQDAIVLGRHAELRHGIDAVYARQCAQDPGAHLFVNPQTGRKALVCLTDRGWGLFIFEEIGDKVQEITSFIKNKARSYTDVVKYMERAGYKLVH